MDTLSDESIDLCNFNLILSFFSYIFFSDFSFLNYFSVDNWPQQAEASLNISAVSTLLWTGI